MAWQTPKTNWTAQDAVSATDMNRIEGNISELKKASTVDIADTAGNFTATNVEDALQELAGNVQTGKNSIASSITAMGQSASGTETFSSLSNKIRAISTDATAGTGDVLSGKTFYQGGVKRTGAMPSRGSPTWTPGTSNIVLPSGYYSGGTIVGDPDLVPANIKQGVNIFGVTGTYDARRFASGSVDVSSSYYIYTISVRGLPFSPSVVVCTVSGGVYRFSVYANVNGTVISSKVGTSSEIYNSYATMYTDGFNIEVLNGNVSNTWKWMAIE